MPGKGVVGRVGAARYRLGSIGYLREHGLAVPDALIEPLQSPGQDAWSRWRTTTRALGVLAIADRLRRQFPRRRRSRCAGAASRW